MKKKCITLYGPFDYEINFVHASDVAKASILIMKKKGEGIYNIATEKSYTIESVAKMCIKIVGSGSLITKNKSLQKERNKKVFNLNNNLIKRRYNFKPTMTIEKGLKQTFKDFIKYEIL